MVELKKYSKDNANFDLLLKFLKSVEKEFTPPLTSYMPLKDYLKGLTEKGEILYIIEKNKIIGLLGYFEYDKRYNSAYIRIIVMNKEHRDKNYGRLLLKECLSDLKNKASAVKITSWSTNKKARLFYEKYGFKLIKHKIDDRGKGIGTLIFKKTL
tara:strand:+ start:11716 stop:12180 length:465 start_codon:yes stop_codon:yes gene_type:complete